MHALKFSRHRVCFSVIKATISRRRAEIQYTRQNQDKTAGKHNQIKQTQCGEELLHQQINQFHRSAGSFAFSN